MSCKGQETIKWPNEWAIYFKVSYTTVVEPNKAQFAFGNTIWNPSCTL